MKTGSFSFRFACAAAALGAAALALGAKFAGEARSSRAALAAFRAEGAALLDPVLREEAAWQRSLVSFAPASGPLPPAFSAPGCASVRSDVRFVPGAGADVREETFEFRSISLAELSAAVDAARAAGYRPVAISVDALPASVADAPSVRASVTLVSLFPVSVPAFPRSSN